MNTTIIWTARCVASDCSWVIDGATSGEVQVAAGKHARSAQPPYGWRSALSAQAQHQKNARCRGEWKP